MRDEIDMLSMIKQIIGILSRRYFRFTQPIKKGVGTITLQSFSIEIRDGKQCDRIDIGKNCLLGCSIVLEREIGTIHIGNSTYIGSGTKLICSQNISIGSNVLIAWGCTIIDHDSHSILWTGRSQDVQDWRIGIIADGIAGATKKKKWDDVPKAEISIMDKVWIGFNVIVLKGVTISEGAVVGAGSVVTKDVPPWTVVAGNPARVIREIPDSER